VDGNSANISGVYPGVSHRSGRKAALFATVGLLIGIASCLAWRAVWPSPPHLIDQVDRSISLNSSPIIVVGVLRPDTLVRSPVPMHSNPRYPLQLRKLIVDSENVLRGAPIPARITVYYFGFAGGFEGLRPLGFWKVGGRRILGLQRDSGVLRTACDGWDSCTKGVYSGAHPHYKPDPKKPLEYALVDLLFTRGEGTVNEIAFATELNWEAPDQVQGLQAYSVEKLRRLALTEHGDVKSSACEMLWIYTVDRIDPAIRRDADNAMRAANCRCVANIHGPEQCH